MHRIMVCDLPDKFDALKQSYNGKLSYYLMLLSKCLTPLGVPGITVLSDGHHVSRTSDFIMYAVEAEFIDRVVAQYGPCESYTSPWIFPFIYKVSFCLSGVQRHKSVLLSLDKPPSKLPKRSHLRSTCRKMSISYRVILYMVPPSLLWVNPW
jgi:hypothetical protein